MKQSALKPLNTAPDDSAYPLNRPDDAFDLSETTVKLLLRYVEPISMDENCIAVLDRFIRDEHMNVATIVDENNVPIGIVDRGRLLETFIKPFARDLHHKKAIGPFMDGDAIMVDIHTGIDDLAQIIISAGMRHMVNGFVIMQNGVYAGMGTGHHLLQEITHRKQRHLYLLAHYDQLTELPNRLLFHDRLEKACQNSKRTGHEVGLIFVDLDRFKYINDTMGHAFGDFMLKSVGKLLCASVRESDTVARLGGDEFVVILQNIHGVEDAVRVSEAIIERLKQPMTIYDRDIQVTASLGIALYPLPDPTVDGVIRKADVAMYEAKQSGRNNYQIYREEFSEDALERMSLETCLKSALEKREFSLFYQPQLNLASGQVVGVEALLRWQHPELGMVSPAKFIPIAEETGLIVPIGEWVLREACRQHGAWLEKGLPPVRVAINISPGQFRQKEFCDTVKAVIEATQIDPQFIELELTEGMVMTDADQTIATLAELRNLGIKLAIDDFGTGYSSLSYLRRFPLDRIKIDQSFIRNIQNIPANEAIVRAIITLGNNLGLEIIAEGVETQDELECIKKHDCREVQGYHFARPVAADDFEDWLQQHTPDQRVSAPPHLV